MDSLCTGRAVLHSQVPGGWMRCVAASWATQIQQRGLAGKAGCYTPF